MDWAEKYRPAHLDEVVGNSAAIRQMFEWAKSWTRESRPLILYGKPGTGKTSSAHALAHDMRWEVVELNASDQRTRAVIERVAGGGSTTGSLTGAERKLILLDEADNLHGNADRGGARAILDTIKQTRQPVILIANDLYSVAGEIRSRCDTVQFKAIQARSMVPRLRFICSAENVACDGEVISRIAENSRGDLRAAVTMLYASALGKEHLSGTGVPASRKDERATVFDLIAGIYRDKPGEALLRLAYETEETPDTLLQWVEGSLFSGIRETEKLAEAYHFLSRADEYLGYTYRQQYYILWRYATSLAILGVSGAAGGGGIHARISPPERWRRMGSYQRQKAVRAGMLRKVAGRLHMSQSTLQDEYLSSLGLLIERDPLYYARDYSLDADELNFFLHDRAAAQSVARTLAAEEKEKEVKREKDKGRSVKKKAEPAAEKSDDSRAEKNEDKAADAPAMDKVSDRTQKTLFEGF